MRQSENMVLEAMTRLSSVHDALEEMLGGGNLASGSLIGHPGMTSPHGAASRSNSVTSTSSFTRPPRH